MAPCQLASSRGSLRARPAGSHLRGHANLLLEAGDAFSDCLCVVHDRSLGQHLRVMDVEGLGGDARAAVLGTVSRVPALRATGELGDVRPRRWSYAAECLNEQQERKKKKITVIRGSATDAIDGFTAGLRGFARVREA